MYLAMCFDVRTESRMSRLAKVALEKCTRVSMFELALGSIEPNHGDCDRDIWKC